MELSERVARAAADISSVGCIDWEMVQELCRSVDSETGIGIVALIDSIRRRYEEDIACAKGILRAKAEEYDCALARLQYMEEQAEMGENGVTKRESTLPSRANFEITNLSGLGGDRYIRFPELGSEGEEEKRTCDSGTQTESEGNETAMYCKIRELIQQNKKYLELGLNWKMKCEMAEKSYREMAERHEKEMKNIAELICQIPTLDNSVSKQIQSIFK